MEPSVRVSVAMVPLTPAPAAAVSPASSVKGGQFAAHASLQAEVVAVSGWKLYSVLPSSPARNLPTAPVWAVIVYAEPLAAPPALALGDAAVLGAVEGAAGAAVAPALQAPTISAIATNGATSRPNDGVCGLVSIGEPPCRWPAVGGPSPTTSRRRLRFRASEPGRGGSPRRARRRRLRSPRPGSRPCREARCRNRRGGGQGTGLVPG